MTIKSIFTLLLITFSVITSYSQSTIALRQPASEKTIPKIILSTFKQQYPDVYLKGWFITHISYWQNDYSSGWYSDWYGKRTVVVYTFGKPTYFEVEFIGGPGELSRAIYNLNGYWYETRTQIKGLPILILEALKESEYSGWKISELKEKIASPGWPDDIYRFNVYKAGKSRIVRMDEKGNIIQEKYLGD